MSHWRSPRPVCSKTLTFIGGVFFVMSLKIFILQQCLGNVANVQQSVKRAPCDSNDRGNTGLRYLPYAEGRVADRPKGLFRTIRKSRTPRRRGGVERFVLPADRATL